MKKLVLLGILLLSVFSLAVAADYAECSAKCKEGPYRECLATGASEQDCVEKAYEPCAAQCPKDEPADAPEPVLTETCETKCKGDYERCAVSGTSPDECRQRMDKCVGECVPAYQRPQPRDCASLCKDSYGHNEAELRRCLSAKCGVEMPPLTCIERCDLALKACEQRTDGKIDCKAMHSRCRTICSPATAVVPCEERCKQSYGADPDEFRRCVAERCVKKEMPCEMRCAETYSGDADMLRTCIREKCQGKADKPECPQISQETGCEMKCAHGYFECRKRALSITDEEDQKSDLLQCRGQIADCLDVCHPKDVAVETPDEPKEGAAPEEPSAEQKPSESAWRKFWKRFFR